MACYLNRFYIKHEALNLKKSLDLPKDKSLLMHVLFTPAFEACLLYHVASKPFQVNLDLTSLDYLTKLLVSKVSFLPAILFLERNLIDQNQPLKAT